MLLDCPPGNSQDVFTMLNTMKIRKKIKIQKLEDAFVWTNALCTNVDVGDSTKAAQYISAPLLSQPDPRLPDVLQRRIGVADAVQASLIRQLAS